MNFPVEVSELVTLLNAVEVALNKKIYSKEEVDKIFPVWNVMVSNFEKAKRKAAIEKMYEDAVIDASPPVVAAKPAEST